MSEIITNMAIRWTYSDGGRAEAGFKGSAGDCATRAIAIATGRPYLEIYNRINELAQKERPRRGTRSSARTGVRNTTTRKLLAELGAEWVPVMGIGSGCTVHVAQNELPSGRLVLKLSKHVAAVIDGVLYDDHDSSREGTRCVYGYWIIKEPTDA